MEATNDIKKDRVRKTTPEKINRKLDKKTTENIIFYSVQPPDVIEKRLVELDKEWDIERVLELNASVFALGGLVMSFIRGPRWLLLPAVVTSFLTEHAIHGWCPPLPIFRALGYRTRKEIDREKYALRDALDMIHGGELLERMLMDDEMEQEASENEGIEVVVVETNLEPVL